MRAPALTVGTATYPSANYVVLHDLHQYGYDVVLGTDAFAHTRVTIDYGAKTVTLAPSGTESEGDLTFQNFIPVAPIRLDDVTLHLAVDTGDESAINLSYDTYEQHQSLFKVTGSAPVSGIGGASEEVTGDLKAAHFGRLHGARPEDRSDQETRRNVFGTYRRRILGTLHRHVRLCAVPASISMPLTGDASVSPS